MSPSPTTAAGQGEEVEVVGVEHGDDGERPDVVDDGEGEEEDPQARRVRGTDEREHAEGEGGVGGDDRPPGGPGRGPVVERQEDHRRHDEPADGREDGQQAREGFRSSPRVNSRRTSSPTTKKNSGHERRR